MGCGFPHSAKIVPKQMRIVAVHGQQEEDAPMPDISRLAEPPKEIIANITQRSDESIINKLSREVSLLADGTTEGIKITVEKKAATPLSTAGEIACSVLAAAALTKLSAKPIIGSGVKILTTAMAVSFVKDVAFRTGEISKAVCQTWDDQTSFERNKQKVADTLGPWVVDTALYTAGGMAGHKLVRNSLAQQLPAQIELGTLGQDKGTKGLSALLESPPPDVSGTVRVLRKPLDVGGLRFEVTNNFGPSAQKIYRQSFPARERMPIEGEEGIRHYLSTGEMLNAQVKTKAGEVVGFLLYEPLGTVAKSGAPQAIYMGDYLAIKPEYRGSQAYRFLTCGLKRHLQSGETPAHAIFGEIESPFAAGLTRQELRTRMGRMHLYERSGAKVQPMDFLILDPKDPGNLAKTTAGKLVGLEMGTHPITTRDLQTVVRRIYVESYGLPRGHAIIESVLQSIRPSNDKTKLEGLANTIEKYTPPNQMDI